MDNANLKERAERSRQQALERLKNKNDISDELQVF